MARLDKLIQVLHDQRGDALRFAPGSVAVLCGGAGEMRPVTRDALSAEQIMALMQEIAPSGAPEGSSFTYGAPAGSVNVHLESAPGGTVAVLRPAVAGLPARVEVTPAAVVQDTSAMEALLRLMVERDASDLHLRADEPPILRVAGRLERAGDEPVPGDALRGLLYSIMAPKDRDAFDSVGDADWAWEIAGLARFRCNAGLDRRGPMAVVRVIPTRILTAGELGLSAEVQRLCGLSKGLVLVTGPTGSGKSTTLAGMIDLVNRTRQDHILTIEDPIEFVHQSQSCLVTQRQVGSHTKTFKAALRAALREDPDVVLVGEMRDLETVSTAIETAETGHLVFGTLHTTTAASTVDRIIDQFPADQQSQIRVMLAESLRGVVSQVLCRKVGGGRVAAREVLITIPAISNLIREGKTFQIPSIMQTNRKVGMVTLNDALLQLVHEGQVEPEEAFLKSVERSGMLSALKARGHDVRFAEAAA